MPQCSQHMQRKYMLSCRASFQVGFTTNIVCLMSRGVLLPAR